MKCFMKSTGHRGSESHFGFFVTPAPPHLHTRLSYMLWCMTAVGQVNRKPIFPQLSAQPLRPQDPGQPHPKRWVIANSPLHVGGRELKRQELQELREKQNLADVLLSEVPGAVSQLALLWPRGTGKWRNGKHLKSESLFAFSLGEGFSL